jgi:hypothetical protein
MQPTQMVRGVRNEAMRWATQQPQVSRSEIGDGRPDNATMHRLGPRYAARPAGGGLVDPS